jgi:hypothetical protein
LFAWPNLGIDRGQYFIFMFAVKEFSGGRRFDIQLDGAGLLNSIGVVVIPALEALGKHH